MTTHLISSFFLFISALVITIAGGTFAVKGAVLLIPDQELQILLIALTVGFEFAKVTGSTFLFHEANDKECPLLLKVILSLVVAFLICLSAVFTYSHLNASISKSMADVNLSSGSSSVNNERSTTKKKEIIELEERIISIKGSTKTDKEKERLTAVVERKLEEKRKELDALLLNQDTLSRETVNNDKFLFLSSISKLTGLQKEELFVFIVGSIVCLIDPLAISLFLAASLIFEKYARARVAQKMIHPQEKNLYENVPHSERVIEAEGLSSVCDSAESRDNDKEIQTGVIEQSCSMEPNGDSHKQETGGHRETDAGTTRENESIRKKLIRIKDYLTGGTDNGN